MNSEIQNIWQEVIADLATNAVLWQLTALVVAGLAAWAVNGILRAYVLRQSQQNLLNQSAENIKLTIGGVNRILFPLSMFLFVLFAMWLLTGWHHHVGILKLACKLLFAMAAIRLLVYAVRYIFTPSSWLKTFEHLTVWGIWGLLALHLTGVLPKIGQALEDITFKIGKTPVNLLLIFQGILTVVATLFVALWLSRMLENKLMRAEQVSVNMRVVLVKLVRIFFMFIAVLIALSAVGLDITLLSVFGGALGVGLGFGLQKIASNYVSGFIILLDKSMNIGDIISVDKHYGVIQDMRSRYMVLAKLDGTNVIIPNETLITTAVVNHSLHEHKGGVPIHLVIAFSSPLEQALTLMESIAMEQERAIQTPRPLALVKGFNEFGMEITLTVWVTDPEKGVAALQSALYLAIWKAFKQNKIELAKSTAKPE